MRSSRSEREKYLRLGCRYGSPDACHSLYHDVFSKHPDDARMALEKMCAISGEGCSHLSDHPPNKKYSERFTKENRRVLSRIGCDELDSKACFNLGWATDKGASQHLSKFERSCSLGNAASCDKVGFEFFVKRDFKNANLYADRACELENNPDFCFRAARSASYVADGSATNYYRRACTKKKPHLCEKAGAHIERNSSGLSAYSRPGSSAYQFYEKADDFFDDKCKAGNISACKMLAHSKLFGEGIIRDTKAGIALLEKSCEAQPSACATLGLLYQGGKFVEKDLTRAALLFDKSCANNEGRCLYKDLLAIESEQPLNDPEGFSKTVESNCLRGGYCDLYAYELLLGKRVAKDVAKADALIGVGCAVDRGSEPCILLAKAKLKAGQREQAEKILRTSCFAHEVKACNLWASLLKDGAENARTGDHKLALFRGCLEDDQSMCAEYKTQYGAHDVYGQKAKARLLKDKRVRKCLRGGQTDIHLEVLVAEDGQLSTQKGRFASSADQSCVEELLEKRKLKAPPAALSFVLSFYEKDQRPLRITTKGAPRQGNKRALINVVVFGDSGLGTQHALKRFEKLMKENGLTDKVSVAWKHKPLSVSEGTRNFEIALAAEALRAQGEEYFWSFIKLAQSMRQRDWNAAAYAPVVSQLGLSVERFEKALEKNRQRFVKRIEKDSALADALGVRSSPHFFIDGWRVGHFSDEKVLQTIEKKTAYLKQNKR